MTGKVSSSTLPWGLVEPDDPEAKIKFLAAEALRGVGGLVINAEGQRFCNELGRRDYVTGEMWKSKPPFSDLGPQWLESLKVEWITEKMKTVQLHVLHS